MAPARPFYCYCFLMNFSHHRGRPFMYRHPSSRGRGGPHTHTRLIKRVLITAIFACVRGLHRRQKRGACIRVKSTPGPCNTRRTRLLPIHRNPLRARRRPVRVGGFFFFVSTISVLSGTIVIDYTRMVRPPGIFVAYRASFSAENPSAVCAKVRYTLCTSCEREGSTV